MKKNIKNLISTLCGLSFLLFLPGWGHAQNFGLVQSNTKSAKTAEAVGTDNTKTKAANASKISGNDDANAKTAEVSKEVKAYMAAQNSKYTLGPTDVVEINVARHPEVSGKYPINSEGKIQFEFVGDVQFSGLTKEEASALVAKRLETYIIKPDVTVKIIEYNSKVVYVIGEVGLPGKIYMRGDTITVRDALLSAGLPQLTASTENATLFTPSDDGKVVQKKVNVYALLYKGDLRENYVMKPGDTVYLPATLWAKVARFINPVTQPVGQAVGTGAAIHGL